MPDTLLVFFIGFYLLTALFWLLAADVGSTCFYLLNSALVRLSPEANDCLLPKPYLEFATLKRSLESLPLCEDLLSLSPLLLPFLDARLPLWLLECPPTLFYFPWMYGAIFDLIGCLPAFRASSSSFLISSMPFMH